MTFVTGKADMPGVVTGVAAFAGACGRLRYAADHLYTDAAAVHITPP